MVASKPTLLQLIEEAHTFPGPYVFKVIGHNKPELLPTLEATVAEALGLDHPPTVKVRLSAGGKHQAVTLTVQVPTAQAVVSLYEALRRVPGVAMLL